MTWQMLYRNATPYNLRAAIDRQPCIEQTQLQRESRIDGVKLTADVVDFRAARDLTPSPGVARAKSEPNTTKARYATAMASAVENLASGQPRTGASVTGDPTSAQSTMRSPTLSNDSASDVMLAILGAAR